MPQNDSPSSRKNKRNNLTTKNNSRNTNNSTKKINQRSQKINSEKIFEKIMSYIPNELNDLPYENAKSYDDRTYCQYYLNLVSNKNLLLFAFYVSNDYNSKIIKINLFFYMFVIHFAVNALFFNDSTMHQIYKDEGNFNFIYQIPQIIYSTLISSVLNTILKFLSLSENDIIKIKKVNVNNMMRNLKNYPKKFLLNLRSFM